LNTDVGMALIREDITKSIRSACDGDRILGYEFLEKGDHKGSPYGRRRGNAGEAMRKIARRHVVGARFPMCHPFDPCVVRVNPRLKIY